MILSFKLRLPRAIVCEVMNDKGGLKREEDFRRSGFLVLFLFFKRVCIVLIFGNLRVRTLSKTSGKLLYLNRRQCSQDFFSPSQLSSHDGCDPFP